MNSFTLTIPVHVDLAYCDVMELFESRAGATSPIDETALAIDHLTAKVAEGNPGVAFNTASIDTEDAVEFSIRAVVDGVEAGPPVTVEVPAQRASSLDIDRYGAAHYGRRGPDWSYTYALVDEGAAGTRIDVTITMKRHPEFPRTRVEKVTEEALLGGIAGLHGWAGTMTGFLNQALEAAIVERRGETPGLS